MPGFRIAIGVLAALTSVYGVQQTYNSSRLGFIHGMGEDCSAFNYDQWDHAGAIEEASSLISCKATCCRGYRRSRNTWWIYTQRRSSWHCRSG